MLRVVITGPESTGKTTLAEALAAHFKVNFVREFAREFLENRLKKHKEAIENGSMPLYTQSDLATIFQGQKDVELRAVQKIILRDTLKLNICDTDALTIKIWSEEVFKSIDRDLFLSIENMYDVLKKNLYVKPIYLLCSPEGMAWEADPLRENPTDRDRLFQIYKENIEFLGFDYFILRGSKEERFKESVKIINRLIKKYFN